MRKNTPPAKLGTVYIGRAKIQVMVEHSTDPNKMVWTTLWEGPDTPNAIAEAIANCRKRSSKPLDLWVKHTFGDREYIGR